MARYPLWISVLHHLAVLRPAARPPASVPVVDFVKEFDRAERRPADGYRMTSESVARSSGHPSTDPRLDVSSGRCRYPTAARFVRSSPVSGGAPVRFRVGVSDERIYEELAEVTVAAGIAAGRRWTPISRLRGLEVEPILSAGPRRVAGDPQRRRRGRGAERVVWGSLQITTDPSSAREYAERRRPAAERAAVPYYS